MNDYAKMLLASVLKARYSAQETESAPSSYESFEALQSFVFGFRELKI